MCATDIRTIRKRLNLLKDLDQHDQISRTKRRSLQARLKRGSTIISRPCSSTFVPEPGTSQPFEDYILNTGVELKLDHERSAHALSESSIMRSVELGRTVSGASSVFGSADPMLTITEDERRPEISNQSFASTPSKRVSNPSKGQLYVVAEVTRETASQNALLVQLSSHIYLIFHLHIL